MRQSPKATPLIAAAQRIQFDQPGVYEVTLALGSTHQLTDGFDGDQDGALDRFGPGLIVDGSIIINVAP